MNLFGIETETSVVPNMWQTITTIVDKEGNSRATNTRIYATPQDARENARCRSLLYGGFLHLAVYDETGFLDSVWQSGERVVSRCD